MNLENLSVQEMNTKELTTTDGGGFWEYVADYVIGEVIGGLVDLAVDSVTNPETYYDADPWDRVI